MRAARLLPFTSELWLATRLAGLWPAVSRELAGWERAARRIPDDGLRHQALASLALKRFHCLGGAVYALDAPAGSRGGLIRLIVALQTISDYLDNLCDRTGSGSVEDFRRLHGAFMDAVADPGASAPGTPARAMPDPGYYGLHPASEPEYLLALVRACREELERLPGYASVEPACRRLAGLYADLQVFKHAPARREALLEAWFAAERRAAGPGALERVDWWEFGAAAGSTLGLFDLFALAARYPGGVPDDVARAHVDTYFPWIGSLHILMDYGIDQDEDAAGGDLNFVSHYPDPASARRGILRIYQEARVRAALLPGPIHRTVVDGLLGFYLSDPKARHDGLARWTHEILRGSAPEARTLWRCCQAARAAGALR